MIGIALGLCVGWFWFVDDTATKRERTERRVAAQSSLEPRRVPADDAPPRRAAEVETARAAFTPDTPTGLSIHRNPDGSLLYHYGGAVIRRRPLAEIDASAREARAQKNWPEFFACILEYAVHDSPDGDRRLLAIMADESLALSGPWIGERFLEALENSTIDGIATAARTRAVAELQDKKGSRWAGRGFFTLVARFGSAEDVLWLDSVGAPGRGAQEVSRALAMGAANPLAAERFAARLAATTGRNLKHWREFVAANPAAAQESATLLIRRGLRNKDAYRMLGAATTAETMESTRAILMDMKSVAARLDGMEAVEQIRRKGLDTTAFEQLIDLPSRILTGAVEGNRNLSTAAVYAIQNREVAWTPSNLDALQVVAQGGSRLAERARKALGKIEAKRNEPAGWEPNRKR